MLMIGEWSGESEEMPCFFSGDTGQPLLPTPAAGTFLGIHWANQAVQA
jgi:hypothetical protein